MAYNMNRKPVKDPTAGKSNKTPAPVTKETAFGRENYGANAYGGASSTMSPGKNVTSPLADDLKQSSDDGEAVLDHVIAKGAAMASADWQTRAISTEQAVPDSFGMASARKRQPSYPGPSSAVPATLTDDDAQPVRKPS